MRVVSLPEQEWVDRFSSVDGLDVVLWDTHGPAPRQDIELAVLGWPSAQTWEHLRQLPALRHVQLISAGYDGAAEELPPQADLMNGRGIHTTATAEQALTLTLAAQRLVPQVVDAQRRQTWEKPGTAPGLADRRVLVVGYGDIGQAVARRMVACEATVVGARRAAHESDGVASEIIAMADVVARLGEFDVVVLLTPLTEATHHLVDAEFLAAMREGALLVNVARGPVVDTDALLSALESGHVRAALDVTDPEPLPDGHPLWSAPGCLVAPHLGGVSQAMTPRLMAFLDDQLHRFAAGGELRNVVIEAREG